MTKNVGNLQGFIMGITSPSMMMRTFGKIESKLALKTIPSIKQIGPNTFQSDITFRDGYREPEYGCRNRIGCYESMPLFFGLPYAKVEHSQCAFKGADHCVYIVHFAESRIAWLSRVWTVLALLALGLGAASLFHPHPIPLAGAGLAALTSAAFIYAFQKHRSARLAMDWSQQSNGGLTRQNRMLESTNEQIQAMQDLTAILSAIDNVQEICDRVVWTMVDRFPFRFQPDVALGREAGVFGMRVSADGYSRRSRLAFIQNTRFKDGRGLGQPLWIAGPDLGARQNPSDQ